MLIFQDQSQEAFDAFMHLWLVHLYFSFLRVKSLLFDVFGTWRNQLHQNFYSCIENFLDSIDEMTNAGISHLSKFDDEKWFENFLGRYAYLFFRKNKRFFCKKTKCILLTIYSSSTFHVWRCSKLILSLAACCGSSFVRDLKIDETNEVENAYGIFIRNLQFLESIFHSQNRQFCWAHFGQSHLGLSYLERIFAVLLWAGSPGKRISNFE